MKFNISLFSTNEIILALGAESAGNFSVFYHNTLYHSSNFGDLQVEENFSKFKNEIALFLEEKKITPNVIITDLHQFYVTTNLGKEFSEKLGAKHIQIQHHQAHIFASVGDKILGSQSLSFPEKIFGIALDGTGFGLDEKIWGGEIFKIDTKNPKYEIQRIGHLENQTLLGGELAIKEPARMIIGILSKFLPKKEVFEFIKEHYNKNQFELLYNQLQQNFNCQETSSAGRILDAISVLLDFSENTREFKHKPIQDLEKNSGLSFDDLDIKIEEDGDLLILNTTRLFEYIIGNIDKDKKRLAATAQEYLAKGVYAIIEKYDSKFQSSHHQFFISGGVSNSKIISEYLESKGAYRNKTIPRGDAGLSLGQIIFHLLSDA